MGYSFCGGCAKQGYWDEFSFRCCEIAGNGGDGICKQCDQSMTRRTCGKCEHTYCQHHGDVLREEYECCGLTLCGHAQEGSYCHLEHTTHMLPCGHMGCNFYDEMGCRVCTLEEEEAKENAVILQDKPLVESLLKRAKSKVLNNFLSEWLQEAHRKEGSCRLEKKRDVREVLSTISSPCKRIKIE